MDYTTVHPSSQNQIQHIDLHLWRGAPENLDEEYPIEILVNQGYVVGFCKKRLQPAWSAYRVAHADDDVDYDRPHVYYDDMRLGGVHRIGPKTFGKIGGIQLNVGHMTPNEVINRQYGRLAQMETFFMSNMSPQYETLNKGVWLKLENSIRAIEDTSEKDHVWVIVGPIFDENPEYISRIRNTIQVPVPISYFCITVDPHSYPYKYPSNVSINCFIIPQNAAWSSAPEDYPATLEEIESATNLKFFEKWGRELEAASFDQKNNHIKSRLDIILEKNSIKSKEENEDIWKKNSNVTTTQDLINQLASEALEIRNRHDSLTDNQINYLSTLQHSISCLEQVKSFTESTLTNEKTPAPQESTKVVESANFITYKIQTDLEDKLKTGARIACNFWNKFIQPKFSVIIRLDLFSQNNETIARAYEPYENDNTRYGIVEFNTKFLSSYSKFEIAGTIVHELGHTLGIGWHEWNALFDHETGNFLPEIVRKLNSLGEMEVELDGGYGTSKAHWDEHLFRNALMTGYKNENEVVLPITIDIMALLGHEVIEKLESTTELSKLLSRMHPSLLRIFGIISRDKTI